MNDKELIGLMNDMTDALLSIAEALEPLDDRLKAIEKAIKKIDSGVI